MNPYPLRFDFPESLERVMCKMIIDQTMVGGVAQILDLNGRLVQTIQLNSNTISLHKGELANGVYHIQLQNNGIVKHQRLQFN